MGGHHKARIVEVVCEWNYYPFVAARGIQGFVYIRRRKTWRPYGNGRGNMPWWPLWETVSYNKEMLLYAQREYMCKRFPHYDPARQDLWEDKNRPWDFDHICKEISIDTDNDKIIKELMELEKFASHELQ